MRSRPPTRFLITYDINGPKVRLGIGWALLIGLATLGQETGLAALYGAVAALGAWLGWQAVLPIVLMASVLGAIVGLVMKATGSLREGRFVPFGPFLAGGGVVVMLSGLPTVLEWIGWA